MLRLHTGTCKAMPSFRTWFSSIIPINSFGFRLAVFSLGISVILPAQSKVTTLTSLNVTANSNATTSVPSGTIVTLTATVTPASGTVRAGQVNFCDATAKSCTDIHLLGTAQLTSAGTATLKLRPGLGSHQYKVVFLGTNSFGGSASPASSLTVTGTIPQLSSTTTINQTGDWGAYTLSATVTETGNTAPPGGLVSFLDTNHGNAVLGTGALGVATRGIAWTTVNTTTNVAGVSYAAADLNHDGIPDLFVKDYFGTYDALLGKGDGTFTVVASAFGPSSQSGAFVVGDFNDDGIPDVAAVDTPLGNSTNTLTIFLGNGDGTFTVVAATSPALGLNPSALATADINGDGNADLIVAQSDASGNGQVLIFFGNGDGTFTQASNITSVTAGAGVILPGDLNNDGKMDLLLTGVGATGNTVLLGNGDGTFTSVAGPGQSSEMFAALGDLNNDGILDLVFSTPPSGDLTVYLGNGDGMFTQAPASPNAEVQLGSSFVIADFNQDGVPDIVYSTPYATTAGVLFGVGDGTFVQQTPTLSYPYDFSGYLLVADFNGDGWPDVLTEDGNSRTFIDSLTQPTETVSASSMVSLAVAGNHLADASYAGDSNYSGSASGTIPLWGDPPATSSVLTLTSAGSPVTSVASGTAVTLTATVSAGASQVTTGQVNFCDASATYCTDIHLLATASLTSNGTAYYKFIPGAGAHSYKAVFVESGLGLSSTSNSVSLTVGPAPNPVYTETTSISSGGYPGDYSLTATVVGYGGTASPTGNISFLDTSYANANLGTAAFGKSTPGLGWLVSQLPALNNPPIAEIAGDFNGDGIPDLALLWTSSSNSGPYSITMFIGTGNGTLVAGPTVTVGLNGQTGPYMIAGDFNGDGKTDLAVLSWNTSNFTSYVTTLLGNGDATFAAPQSSVAYAQGVVGGDGLPGSLVAADFNGDGKLDVAIVGDYVSSGGVSVLLGNGDGTFRPGIVLAPSKDFGQIATGDFNGDGIPDLVATSYFEFGHGPTIFLGKGDGTFTETTASFSLDYFATSIVVGDFNGDGVLDLAFSDLNGIEIALGNGDGSFKETTASPIPVTSELYSVKAGDFNHDGKLDLAGVDNYNNQIDILLGNGDGTFAETVTTPKVGQTALGPFAIVAADFNSDGAPDLALLTKQVNSASILLTEPTQTETATVNGIAPVGAGTHNVEASYPGDSNYPAGVSSTVALTAGLAPLVITPASGTYSSMQNVTISESIPGASIYYSAYGNLNTNGFVPYTGPIALQYGGYETIQAYATESGYIAANPTVATYYLNLPTTATPAISLPPGYYSGPQTVTITDSDSSAKIYYTTNGTVPTLSSSLYTGPLSVSTSETLVVRALSSAHSISPTVSAAYVIGSSNVPLIYSVAGTGMQGYTGDGGPATLAQLGSADAVVKDASGNLYIADAANHMVRKIAAGTGSISVVAGTGVIGYSGDGGAASSAEFYSPATLALDSVGDLYVGDNGNGVVRKINLASGVVTTFAGSPTATAQGDGGPATSAVLGYIYGIAVDASLNLYISCNNSIRVVNSSTGIITSITGTTWGYTGDGGPVSNASFEGIQGLAFDSSGNLYLADVGNDLIRKIAASNGAISSSSIVNTVAGTIPVQAGVSNPGYSGDGGPATSAKLDSPSGVALDKNGNLFISDSGNNAVREVTASNGIIVTVAGNGACGAYGGDGAGATASSVCFPDRIAIDSGGNLYIADAADRIREVIAAAPPSAQTSAPQFSVASGNYASAQSIAITDATPGASIYVTVDGSTPTTASAGYSLPINVTGNITIKAIATAPGFNTSPPVSATYSVSAFAPMISTFAGTGIQGFSEAGGPALNVMFGQTTGTAFDKSGNLYVADRSNNVIWKISSSSGIASVIAGTGFYGYSGDGGAALNASLNNPMGLAVDSVGNLYVADASNNAIREIAVDTGIITTYAGGHFSLGPNLGDGGPATAASLGDPLALAFDSADNLYITDTYDNLIRKVTKATGIITTVAGGGTSVSGGDGGPATSAGLLQPNSVAVAANGDIYIGTTYGARIRKVAAASGIITSIAGIKDLAGQTGEGGQATQAEVLPSALALDASGNLYVGNFPGEIREINTATGVISNVAGIGYPGYSGDGGAAADAQISNPFQLAFDASGNLYFADYSYRVRKVTLVAQAAGTPVFSLSSGTYTGSQTVTITEATPGAAVYFTTDGSTPTNSSATYTGPITVSSSETLNAIAIAVGYHQSAEATATYVLTASAPTPTITSLSPAFTNAGTAQFTLTLNGSGFTNASSAYWGTSTLSTQFVSSTQLTATVPVSDISSAGISSITVQTPAPGGGTSNAFLFEIDTAGSGTAPSFSPDSSSVSAGSAATYTVTLPPSATNVSVRCLNLPTGATCSYSPSSGTLTISTSSSTPSGTYEITVVFTETLPGAAAALVLLPFLVAPTARRRREKRQALWLLAVSILALASVLAGCGGGSGGNGSGGGGGGTQTHQITSSGTVTLAVK